MNFSFSEFGKTLAETIASAPVGMIIVFLPNLVFHGGKYLFAGVPIPWTGIFGWSLSLGIGLGAASVLWEHSVRPLLVSLPSAAVAGGMIGWALDLIEDKGHRSLSFEPSTYAIFIACAVVASPFLGLMKRRQLSKPMLFLIFAALFLAALFIYPFIESWLR